jgi:hypothetical protein
MALMSERATSIGRAIVGALLFVGALIALGINSRWISNVMAGPQPITAEDLAKLDNPNSLRNPWVKVSAKQRRETEIRQDTTKRWLWKQETRTTKYVLLQVDNRWLLAEVPQDDQGQEVIGTLTAFKANLAGERMDRIQGMLKPNPNSLLPFQLEADDEYKSQCYILLGVAGGLGALGLIMGGVGVFGLLRSPEEPPPEKKGKKRPASRDEDEDEEPAPPPKKKAPSQNVQKRPRPRKED